MYFSRNKQNKKIKVRPIHHPSVNLNISEKKIDKPYRFLKSKKGFLRQIFPVNKIGGGAWYPVAGVLGESTEKLLKSLPSAHKYRAYSTNTCNFLLNGSSSTMDSMVILLNESRVRHSQCLII